MIQVFLWSFEASYHLQDRLVRMQDHVEEVIRARRVEDP